VNKQKKKQRMAGSAEVQKAVANSSTGGAVKPTWSTYSAAGKGGSGFDGKDIKYLQKQGLSNNDIMRAAAASGDVRSGADQRLRKLNTQAMSARDLPESVMSDIRKHAGMTGAIGGMGQADYIFLGGDRKDSSNYQIRARSNEGGGQQGLENVLIGASTNDLIGQWNRKAANQRGGGKDGKSVLTWQGINADGSANAPTGTMTVKRENGKLGEMYKEKGITWRLPQDVVNAGGQAASTATTTAQAPATTQASATTAGANQSPAVATPKAPAFNVTDWMTPVQSSSSSSSSNSHSTTESSNDTTPSLFNRFMGDGQGSFSYGGATAGSGSGVSSGAPVNDYASFLNVAEGRDPDWSGDVWSSGSSRSNRPRMSGSGEFLDALSRSQA